MQEPFRSLDTIRSRFEWLDRRWKFDRRNVHRKALCYGSAPRDADGNSSQSCRERNGRERDSGQAKVLTNMLNTLPRAMAALGKTEGCILFRRSFSLPSLRLRRRPVYPIEGE